jgi:hypothetical protein
LNCFQHPQWGILLTPNKCGSTYAQTLIPKKYHKNKNDLVLKNSVVWAIVRDPVEWYVSGWRYAVSHLIAEAKDMNYNLNFQEHLEYCTLQKTQVCFTNRQYNQFDRHTWYNPYLQCQDISSSINKIIKIENQERFNQVIKFFSDGKDPETPKNVNDGEKAQRNGKTYISKPKLNESCIKLLHQLDDWSFLVGYNLTKSIQNYINTLCY